MIPPFPSWIPLADDHCEEYTHASAAFNLENADLSFTEIYIWRDIYKPFLSKIEDSLCVKLIFKNRIILFPPTGPVSFQKVVPAYMSYLKDQPYEGYIGGLSKKQAESTGKSYEFDRDNSDYLYATADLADLPGKKYHAKRNLIRQFQKRYTFSFEPLDCISIEGCLTLAENWCDIKNCDNDPLLHAEEHVAKEALTNCRLFKHFGGVIKIEKKIIAFTVASALNPSTAVIHIEKADTHFKGVYQAINNIFAKQLKEKYTWINRESDMGEEGLRKAKLSYYPSRLIEKYYIKI